MNKEKISKRLQNMLENEFVAVSEHKNPIIKNIGNLTHKQKIEVLSQYSIFPKNIISMLVSATYSLSYFSWENVVEELTLNISEEMGLGDGKIAEFALPHYTILRKVFMDCFETDINLIDPKSSTLSFIEDVKEILNSGDPEFICGGVYALESSAVPELSIVKKMVISALQDLQKDSPKLMLDFFDWHVNEIEVEHRDRLLNMVDKHIKDEKEWIVFESGFKEVMIIMDRWWTTLNEEIMSSKSSNPKIVIDVLF